MQTFCLFCIYYLIILPTTDAISGKSAISLSPCWLITFFFCLQFLPLVTTLFRISDFFLSLFLVPISSLQCFVSKWLQISDSALSWLCFYIGHTRMCSTNVWFYIMHAQTFWVCSYSLFFLKKYIFADHEISYF